MRKLCLGNKRASELCGVRSHDSIEVRASQLGSLASPARVTTLLMRRITRFLPILLAILALLAACAQPSRTPVNNPDSDAWFEEQAGLRGLSFVHQSGASGEYDLPEITGGGVALLDVENDGDLDIYFIQSGSLKTNQTEVNRNALYLNDGDGYFSLNLDHDGHADRGYGMGVAVGDYDADGDVDIYVTNLGENALLQNNGNGQFTNVASEAGVASSGWSTAASFADFDRDGDLDLYVVNYLHWDPATALDCFSTNIETYCVPLHNYAAMDRIYQNNGDGTFTDRTREAGLAAAFGNGLGAVSVDINDDGWVDVFVANDSMVNQLWLNQGDFTFVNDAWYWGAAMDDHGIEKAGMGIVTFDLDNDADFDVLVVNIEEQTDSFFRNEGTYFSDATAAVNLSAHSRRFTRFGLVAADFDNDGCIDLYQANGSVYHDEEDLWKDDYFKEPNTLYRGTCKGSFELVQPEGGTATPLERTSRGLAVGDLDGDGSQDLVVVNKDSAASLLINVTKSSTNQGYVKLRLLDEKGSDAYNATVRAQLDSRQIFERMQTDGSYLAAHDPHVHIGLASAKQLDSVEVKWLSGNTEHFGSLGANRVHILREGTGKLVPNSLR